MRQIPRTGFNTESNVLKIISGEWINQEHLTTGGPRKLEDSALLVLGQKEKINVAGVEFTSWADTKSSSTCYQQELAIMVHNETDITPWGKAYRVVLAYLEGMRFSEHTCPLLFRQNVFPYPLQHRWFLNREPRSDDFIMVTVKDIIEIVMNDRDDKAPIFDILI